MDEACTLFRIEFLPTPAYPDHVPISFAIAPHYEAAALMVARKHGVPIDRVLAGDFISTVLVIDAAEILTHDTECQEIL